MCAACDVGYYKEDSGQCKSCGSSQAITLYIIGAGAVIVPLMAIAASVDGNKHDARFGLVSIVVAWLQYTGV